MINYYICAFLSIISYPYYPSILIIYSYIIPSLSHIFIKYTIILHLHLQNQYMQDSLISTIIHYKQFPPSLSRSQKWTIPSHSTNSNHSSIYTLPFSRHFLLNFLFPPLLHCEKYKKQLSILFMNISFFFLFFPLFSYFSSSDWHFHFLKFLTEISPILAEYLW